MNKKSTQTAAGQTASAFEITFTSIVVAKQVCSLSANHIVEVLDRRSFFFVPTQEF